MRDPAALARARRLRREMTPAEWRLWYHLRAGRSGANFRRQTPIGPYIADFTCRAAMLVVEVDGDTHANQVAHDERRTVHLQAKGWRVIRFTNADVMENVKGVLATIGRALPLSPALSPEGEREKKVRRQSP